MHTRAQISDERADERFEKSVVDRLRNRRVASTRECRVYLVKMIEEEKRMSPVTTVGLRASRHPTDATLLYIYCEHSLAFLLAYCRLRRAYRHRHISPRPRPAMRLHTAQRAIGCAHGRCKTNKISYMLVLHI